MLHVTMKILIKEPTYCNGREPDGRNYLSILTLAYCKLLVFFKEHKRAFHNFMEWSQLQKQMKF